MHMTPMSDGVGKFGESKKSVSPCAHCGSFEHYYQVWESDCGGYEDEKHECHSCKRVWWVEGPDS